MSVELKTGCTDVLAHTQKSGVRDCHFSEQSCLLEYEAVLFPYNVLNQFFVITHIGDRQNAPPQRRAGSILIQEWQLRAPSDGSEFHFPWVLYTLNRSDRLTLLTVFAFYPSSVRLYFVFLIVFSVSLQEKRKQHFGGQCTIR